MEIPGHLFRSTQSDFLRRIHSTCTSSPGDPNVLQATVLEPETALRNSLNFKKATILIFSLSVSLRRFTQLSGSNGVPRKKAGGHCVDRARDPLQAARGPNEAGRTLLPKCPSHPVAMRKAGAKWFPSCCIKRNRRMEIFKSMLHMKYKLSRRFLTDTSFPNKIVVLVTRGGDGDLERRGGSAQRDRGCFLCPPLTGHTPWN